MSVCKRVLDGFGGVKIDIALPSEGLIVRDVKWVTNPRYKVSLVNPKLPYSFRGDLGGETIEVYKKFLSNKIVAFILEDNGSNKYRVETNDKGFVEKTKNHYNWEEVLIGVNNDN